MYKDKSQKFIQTSGHTAVETDETSLLKKADKIPSSGRLVLNVTKFDSMTNKLVFWGVR